jgi:hypothetical protein
MFVDDRTAALLEYYLGRKGFSTRRSGPDRFWESTPGNYCIVASPLWDPDAKTFVDEVIRMMSAYRLPAGQRLWVMHLGAPGDPTREFLRRFDGAVIADRFGDILVFQVWPQAKSEGSPSDSGGSNQSLSSRQQQAASPGRPVSTLPEPSHLLAVASSSRASGRGEPTNLAASWSLSSGWRSDQARRQQTIRDQVLFSGQ